jgi:mRNA interferase HigB
MKVKLIRKASVESFIAQNARSKSSMIPFLELIKVADWEVPGDIKSTFGRRVDVVCNGDRVVFDCGGGAFRIICRVVFGKKTVFLFVKFIGTHAAYDRLCKAKKNEVGICDVDQYKS